MGLGLVARFSSFVEAEVACGALRAAGFDAQLFDKAFGSVMWIDQTAIGGFRLVVPEAELADAAAYLGEIRLDEPRAHRDPAEKGVGWRLIALLAGLAITPEAGWLVVGVRRRRRGWTAVAFGIALTVLSLVTIGVLLLLLGRFVDSWLIHPRISSG